MTSANYPNCYKITRVYEGGNVDDPRDPGGRTSRGVIQRVYDQYRAEKNLPKRDVYLASENEIAEIYRSKYWDAVLGDQWPEGADLAVWDCGVNSGPRRSKQLAQKILGNLATFGALAASAKSKSDQTVFIKLFCAKRLAFVQGLKNWVVFGGGWGGRIASVEANGVRMALNAQGVSPADQKAKLEQESKAAKGKAATNAGGTIITGSGTAGAGNNTDWTTVDLSLGWKIAFVAALVLLALYFFHWWRAHNERAKAYAAVAAATGV